MACQHSPDDQTLRLQAGAGEDDFIHPPSGPDSVACERQEEDSLDHVFDQTVCEVGGWLLNVLATC